MQTITLQVTDEELDLIQEKQEERNREAQYEQEMRNNIDVFKENSAFNETVEALVLLSKQCEMYDQDFDYMLHNILQEI